MLIKILLYDVHVADARTDRANSMILPTALLKDDQDTLRFYPH